jgi:hypothetical protein
MRALLYAAVFAALCVSAVLCPLGAESALGEETLFPASRQPGDAAAARAAVTEFLREIDQIDKQASQAKAAARAKLLAELHQQPADALNPVQEIAPGLIGTATVEGEPSGIAIHYEHGKLFPRELIWERFHKETSGAVERPNTRIELLGKVEVPQEMTVKVSQAAGGVNMDHGTLFIGDRQLGQVGDDLAKAEVYVLTLPAGVHPVRWVLTGGTFQNGYLKFEDPRTGELLRVSYDDAQRRQTGAADARESIQASADPSEWLQAMGPQHWRWVPLAAR